MTFGKRVSRGNYNYGQPLPEPTGETYVAAGELLERLSDIAAQTSERHWRLCMRVRDVRHATTDWERRAAEVKLADTFAELIKFSPVSGGNPIPNQSFADIAAIDVIANRPFAALVLGHRRSSKAFDTGTYARDQLREAAGEVRRETLAKEGFGV